MLTWITVISLVLTFVVGVLSTLFKTVRQHDNRKLPQLTAWGWTLLITLLMLCATSMVLVFVTSKQAEAEAKRAEDAQRELTNQLAELSGANKELRRGNSELRTRTTELQRLAGVNLDTLMQNQEDATNRHVQSLNRLSSLIAREENIGRNTAPAVDRISLVLTLPGQQAVALPFVTRLKNQVRPENNSGPTQRVVGQPLNPVDELLDRPQPIRLDPRSALFPKQRDEKEAELYRFLTFVRVEVLFFKAAPKIQYPKPRVGGFFRFMESPAFTAVVDAPLFPGRIGGFGTSYSEEVPVTVSYDTIDNSIRFKAEELKILEKGFTTWEDLANFYVVVDLDSQTAKPQVTVSSLTLMSSAGNLIEIRDFKPFHQLTYFFIARIPADARWR